MSDWAVGDLAVCVDAAPRSYRTDSGGSLAVGNIYTVEAVFFGAFSRHQMLGIMGFPWEPEWVGWDADRFRKILPDKHEACESEFVDLLKRIKRPVSA
jgi:hypothetical protein